MKDMSKELEKELKVTKLAHAVEKQIMQDNFDKCKTAGEYLKTENDNLRCCGNCTQHETRQCPKYDEYRRTGLWTLAWHYCDHYDSDGLTRGEREGK